MPIMNNYDEDEERVDRLGNGFLDEFGGEIPTAYGLACELPAGHDKPLSSIDRLWYDCFDHRDRDWIFIVNGSDECQEIDSLGLLLEAGAVFVVCDTSLLAKLSPHRITWFVDADSGERLTRTDESDKANIAYWSDELLRVLHARLTNLGDAEDPPPLDAILAGDAGGETED